jgi:uncharacterized delta-60 repeat protein
MKNSIFKLVLPILLFSMNISSQVSQEWVRVYNGPGSYGAGVKAMTLDNEGNIYVTGYSASGNTWGTLDYATIKYNPSGAEQWVQRYNGSANDDDIAKSIAVDNSGNVYVTGYCYSSTGGIDIATIKYNSFGIRQWIHIYNGPGNGADYPNAITIDGFGNVYVTGYAYVTPINDDCVTIKYNSSGQLQWERYYSDTTAYTRDKGISIAVDNSGNVYVGGDGPGGHVSHYLAIKYNSAGIQLWANRNMNTLSSVKSMAVDATGNIYLTGNDGVIKYNSMGVFQWAQPDINGSTVIADLSGNVYTAGSIGLGDLSDYHILKLSSNGLLAWEKTYNGPANRDDKANSIALDDLGNVYVTGGIDMNSQQRSFGTVKYNSSGIQQWVQRYAVSPVYNVPVFIKTSGLENIYIAGSSSENFVTIKYSQLVGIQPISTEIPNQYSLSQNYPNPFNPSTKIKFAIPVGNDRDRSLIKIYDALGREISTLVNEELNPGTYEVDWNAANYPSGVYYYKLVSGDFRETKKMILIK